MIRSLKYWCIFCLFIISCKIPKYAQAQDNILPCSITGLSGLQLHRREPATLPGYSGMVKLGWLGSMWSEIFSQMKFTIFPRCPAHQASPLHIISSMFNKFCWSQGLETLSLFFLKLWSSIWIVIYILNMLAVIWIINTRMLLRSRLNLGFDQSYLRFLL